MDPSRTVPNSSSLGDFAPADWSQWMHWDEDGGDEFSTPPTHFVPSPSAARQRVNSQGSYVHSHQNLHPHPYPHAHNRNLSVTSVGSNSHLSLLQFSSPASPNLNPSTTSASVPVQRSLQTPHLHHQLLSTGIQEPSLVADSFAASLSASPPNRKRKISYGQTNDPIASASDAAYSAVTETLPNKKRSHNVIEKRYRANLNDKIAELRDSVPSLRAIHRQKVGRQGSTEQEDDDDDGAVIASNKLNKASILSKATEYIKHLEVRNKRLDEENLALKNRLRELDRLQQQGIVSASTSSPSGCTNYSDSITTSSPGIYSYTEESPSKGSPNSLYPPEGLIKVPEYFKRMRATSGPQPHYADSILNTQPSPTQDSNRNVSRGGRSGKLANKFMLGSLAGLMVLGGLEQQRTSDSTEKGLLGLPFHLLTKARDLSYQYLCPIRVAPWHLRAISHVALASISLVFVAFFVFIYLFYSQPREPRQDPKARNAQASSTSLPTARFRRDAWLTSIQTVRVPRHTFFPEWYAVTSRCFEYCLRCLLGWSLYSWLTGISEEDEKGRVKAWDIALDAQLSGGDAEVSKSRLVLTIFASGTMPWSPVRCMLKAVHCRILFWNVGVPGSPCEIPKRLAFAFARYQWKVAQRLYKTGVRANQDDELPANLAFLLTMDCDEVLTDRVTQRAFNMIWNRPTGEAASFSRGENLLDAVVQDTSVSSPLDAVASWWSTNCLREALLLSLNPTPTPTAGDSRKFNDFQDKLDLALRSAPALTIAHTRAAVIKAMFVAEKRVENINSALAELPRPNRNSTKYPRVFLDCSVPAPIRREISTAVRCAMIAAILDGQTTGSPLKGTSEFSLRQAIDMFNELPIDSSNLTLLEFAVLYRLLHLVATDERLGPVTRLDASGQQPVQSNRADEGILPCPNLARIAHGLAYWISNSARTASCPFPASVAKRIIQACAEACHIDANMLGQETTFTTEISDEEFSSDESTSYSEVESVYDDSCYVESYSGRSRADSIRSTDTGYASLVTDSDTDDAQIKPLISCEPIDL